MATPRRWQDGNEYYWIYEAYVSPQGIHRIVVYPNNTSIIGSCPYYSPCVYYTSSLWQDVKVHYDPNQNPTGGPFEPGSYSNPCEPKDVKLAWVGGALRVKAEALTELNLSLYDVSGKLLEKRVVEIAAGESVVKLPVKGLNVLVVEGDGFTKTLKVTK